jgi:acetolactate synthase-1/2/3 large subunit
MVDQAALFTPLAKVGESGAPLAKSASNSREAIEFLKELIVEITTAPCGAGYLGIPADILSAAYGGDLEVLAQPSTKPINVDVLAQAIKDSKRIIFWVGGGATEVDREITELSELLKAPIITTFAGRGIGSLSRYSLQVPVHEKEVSELLASADLLIIMGSQFDGMNTKNWTLKLPPKIAVIDAAPELIERNAPVDISLKIDLKPGLFEALLDLLKGKESSGWHEWADIASLNESARKRIATTPEGKSGMRLVDAIDRSWPLEGRMVLDMCIAGYWSGGYLHGRRARRIAYPVGWGTLGFALPTGIGAAIDGTPTLVVAGDGGIAFALAEVATLVQESLPVTILLHDDGGYGMLRYDQKVMNAAERGVDLVNPDWRLLSESFGIRFTETTIDSLASDLIEVQKRKGPHLLLLREPLSPPRTTSPRWRESETN